MRTSRIDPKSWKEIDWPFDSETAAKFKRDGVTVLSAKCGRGRIILTSRPHFEFVASFGPNSDRSHSGCFFGSDGMTIETAKHTLESRDF